MHYVVCMVNFDMYACACTYPTRILYEWPWLVGACSSNSSLNNSHANNIPLILYQIIAVSLWQHVSFQIINRYKKGCGQYDQTTARHAFTSSDYGGTKKSLRVG